MNRPSVLLAEDDPVSALFLSEALRGLGFDVDRCGDGETALSRARDRHFDLLVLDCRMPGMGAERILGRLRADAAAASHASPAVAISAELPASLRTRLLDCGFRETLQKPLDLTELERALRDVRPSPATGSLLDDDAGLRSSGSSDAMHALRGLFADELEALAAQVDDLLADRHALVERLHRLRASCGFCGATVLDHACTALAEASRTSRGGPAEAVVTRFRDALEATLGALREPPPPARG